MIAVGFGWLAARFVHRTTAGFNQAVEVRGTLEERFGPADSFVPPADGAVPPQRMEAFLAVREATAQARERLADTWSDIPLSPAAARELESQRLPRKLRSVFEIARSGVGLGAEMGQLYAARNEALLASGMGLGEYTYIYALAFYSWLGHSPSDGPENAARGDSANDVAFGPRMGNMFMERIRRELLQMLRHQLASLPEGADEPWRRTLAEEIAAMEAKPRRLPWQGGLPPAIAESFEPYRERLEASYDPVTNAFDLGRNRRRGRFSIDAE